MRMPLIAVGEQFAEWFNSGMELARARAMVVIIKFEARPERSVAASDDEKDNFRDDDFLLKWSRRRTALFNYLTANLLMRRSCARANAKTPASIILDIT